MTELTIVRCDKPTELYCHYSGQFQAQPAYLELDLREGTLCADYNAEIGSGIPFSVYHGFQRRYTVPVLTGTVANRLMEELAPLAARILADWESEWDGNNTVVRLGPDAAAAEAELERALGLGSDAYAPEDRFGPGDLVAVWDIDGAVNGCESEEFGITAQTTDERLAEIEQEILASLAEGGEGSVAVCFGLDGYLHDLREQQRSQAAESV